MVFTTSKEFAPIHGKEAIKNLRMFCYIDTNISEETLKAWDDLYIQKRKRPSAYKVISEGNIYFTLGYKTPEYIDFYNYCTWANTLHIRYSPIFKHLGLHRFFHPDNDHRLIEAMSSAAKPLKLSDCKYEIKGASIIDLN